jgi:VanZ family protein
MAWLANIIQNRIFRWGITLIWTAFLTVLLLQPEVQQIIPTGIPPAPPTLEREIFFTIAHLAFFGLTAVLWSFALSKDLPLPMTLLIAALFLLSYGFVSELAQGNVAGRSPQIGDMLANATGICLGLGFFYWAMKKYPANIMLR